MLERQTVRTWLLTLPENVEHQREACDIFLAELKDLCKKGRLLWNRYEYWRKFVAKCVRNLPNG